jgi:hypothetical protein
MGALVEPEKIGVSLKSRTLMYREKIHLFEISREFGFKRRGPDGRGPLGELSKNTQQLRQGSLAVE